MGAVGGRKCVSREDVGNGEESNASPNMAVEDA